MRPPDQRLKAFGILAKILRKAPIGSLAPSENALATRAGVARRTAREAILAAVAAGLLVHRAGHTRCIAAPAHAEPGNAPIVGILTRDLPEDDETALVAAVADAARRDGWRPVLIHQNSLRRGSASLHGCAALIALAGCDHALLAGLDLPRVIIADAETVPGCAQVSHDQAEGGRRIVRALLAAGRRRILRLVTPRDRPWWLQERERGIHEELAANGLALAGTVHLPLHIRAGDDPGLLDRLSRIAAGYLVEWLREPGTIDAIIGTSDSELFIYARALRLWHLRSGHDLALAAYDGYWRTSPEQSHEPLAGCIFTIRKDVLSSAQTAVDLLADIAHRHQPPRCVSIPPILDSNSD